MTGWDQTLKERAARESSPVPAKLDRRVEEMLENLPEQGRTRGTIRPLRAVLLAAALCVLCAVSAFALSPGLREQLAEALGGFGPYMQEIDGAVCVQEGIEVRVISAVADSDMTRVYAEVRDLEGDRLTADLSVAGIIERKVQEENGGQTGGSVGTGKCVGFDEETGTALLEFKTWGNLSNDLGEMELCIFSFFPTSPEKRIEGEQGWRIDLSVEVLAKREVTLSGTVDGAELVEAKISTLGTMLVTRGAANLPASDDRCSVYLKDGTVVHAHTYAGMVAGEDGLSRTYLEFDDPVDPEQVTGISVHYWMIPFDGDTAGEGYWLSELPE